MKNIRLVFTFLISISLYGQKEFPINSDSEIVKKFDLLYDEKKLSTLEGKFYAFDIKVKQVEKAYLDKPYFLAEFPSGEKIWIASLLKSDLIKEDRNLRILGSLNLVEEKDEIAKKFNDKKYQILMFAMLDIETKKAISFEAGMYQAEQWQDGQIPKDLNNK